MIRDNLTLTEDPNYLAQNISTYLIRLREVVEQLFLEQFPSGRIIRVSYDYWKIRYLISYNNATIFVNIYLNDLEWYVNDVEYDAQYILSVFKVKFE